MTDIRPEFLALDRDELSVLVEAFAACSFMSAVEQAKLILHARWEVAAERASKAAKVYADAFNEAKDLKQRPGKLTSARLAEEEKADRRWRKLSRAELKARTLERELWEQVSAEWSPVGGTA